MRPQDCAGQSQDGCTRCFHSPQEPLLRRVQAVTTRPLRLDAVRPEYHRATLHWRPGADGAAGGRALCGACVLRGMC